MAQATLRVAFDARSLTAPVLRGWDRYTVGLAAALVRQGIEVTLLHRAGQVLFQPHVADLGCRIMGLHDRGGLSWEQVAVPYALWQGRFDIFHAPAEHGVPLIAPCPVVLTIHSVTLHSYRALVQRGLLPGTLSDYVAYDRHVVTRPLADWYWKAQYRRAHHILTPSAFCRDEVITLLGAPPSRVTTTPLAVHEQFHRPPRPPAVRTATLQRLGISTPYLLYIGGYEPHKNIRGLLETFALVRRVRSDVSLVLVGSKAIPEAVRQQAAHVGLRPDRDVVFLVDLTDELTDLYDAAELFVTLAWRETFCLPVLEAMTRGLPAVASAWGGIREVIGDVGRLVDPRNYQAAARTILDLLTSTQREVLGAQARKRAVQFTWHDTAARTVDIYARLMSGHQDDDQCSCRHQPTRQQSAGVRTHHR